MERLYRAEFEVHRNCTIFFYVYHCYAQNAKEAIEKTRAGWKHKSHQFGLQAKRADVKNVADLAVKNRYGHVFSGTDAVDWYIITDARVWRVDGRNVFWD